MAIFEKPWKWGRKWSNFFKNRFFGPKFSVILRQFWDQKWQKTFKNRVPTFFSKKKTFLTYSPCLFVFFRIFGQFLWKNCKICVSKNTFLDVFWRHKILHFVVIINDLVKNSFSIYTCEKLKYGKIR